MQIKLFNNQIWLSTSPVDFRMSIDGLTAFVTAQFNLNPQNSIFVFYNKRKDKIKCLSWHKNGFILLYKRLEKGRFHFSLDNASGKINLSPEAFSWLMAGLDWEKMEQWEELNYEKFS